MIGNRNSTLNLYNTFPLFPIRLRPSLSLSFLTAQPKMEQQWGPVRLREPNEFINNILILFFCHCKPVMGETNKFNRKTPYGGFYWGGKSNTWMSTTSRHQNRESEATLPQLGPMLQGSHWAHSFLQRDMSLEMRPQTIFSK